MKDTNIIEIDFFKWVRTVMNVTQEFQIEREPWGAASILIKVYDGIYIGPCSVISDEYRCKEKDAFFYDSHFK